MYVIDENSGMKSQEEKWRLKYRAYGCRKKLTLHEKMTLVTAENPLIFV